MRWFDFMLIAWFSSVGFLALLLFVYKQFLYRKVRKITASLYGDIVNHCVLCPVCEGYVHARAWKEHIEYSHNRYSPHYITPLQEDFSRAKKKLIKGETS